MTSFLGLPRSAERFSPYSGADVYKRQVEDGSRDFGGGKNGGERVLSQEEIDNLLGFSVGDVNLDDHSGIRAIIDSAMVSYERLPMLEIVFDRLVRLMTTSPVSYTHLLASPSESAAALGAFVSRHRASRH